MRFSHYALHRIAVVALGCQAAAAAAPATRPAERLNVLLITADDMNYDSLGVTGCPIPGITPNLDRLAREGMRFVHAHVTAAVCQPSRSVLMTGRYPYNNGAMGFQAIRADVPTLQESLRAAGYFNGIFGKVSHLQPQGKFCWDVVVDANLLGNGRSPQLYYKEAKDFFKKTHESGKPFFLMANAQDPHRPFAGAKPPAVRPRQRRALELNPPATPLYSTADVPMPCFLPDLPEIRTELAQYFTSVHRCDQTVGEILRALKDAGAEESTLVMFLSDNGMPLPFAKTNCYLNSTRTPWIVRWPGMVKPGSIDREHMISGIDFTPTVLAAAGVPQMPGVDGRSFLPLLAGRGQDGRGDVYTVFHETSGRRVYPMRSVQDRRFGYIFNAWSNGETTFQNESTGSPSQRAMQAAAERDPAVAARLKMVLYRVPEELYDYQADPCALHNLIDDPAYAADRDRLRARMREIMQNTKDPLLKQYEEFRK